jgi:23S rRNA U2552 (ribose-2'-O)-methylase RlmE/FtsJ
MYSTPEWQRGALIDINLSFSTWVDKTPQILIDLKEKIEPLEASGQWELLKKMVNPYEIVYTHEHPAFHPSLVIIKPLSRSYFKMLEMIDVLSFYDRIPKQIQKIRTAHIAEGPGGFIQAIVDTAERNAKIHSVATAMTLKPVDSRVPGWRRATAFLQRNRHVKLHYGQDNTGDIYSLENQASFVNSVSPGVSLFTADGGFDFSVNYQIQEQRVFHLLTCSAITAVQSLSIDGCIVLKVFDTYSPGTKALLASLSRFFKEWCIYKPCLSRPCNSERYFLGRGFRGCTAERLRPLKEIFSASLEGRFPEDTALTAEEMAYIVGQDAISTELQVKALSQALFYASHPEEWYTNQLPKDFATSLAWCHKYRVPTQRLVPISLTYQKGADPRS